MHLNAVFMFKLITWPEVSTVRSPVRAVMNDCSKLGLAVRSPSGAALSSPSANPQWRWSLLRKFWCQYWELQLWPSRLVTTQLLHTLSKSHLHYRSQIKTSLVLNCSKNWFLAWDKKFTGVWKVAFTFELNLTEKSCQIIYSLGRGVLELYFEVHCLLKNIQQPE